MAELMVKEEELAQKEELVKCLQEELVQVRIVLYFCIIFQYSDLLLKDGRGHIVCKFLYLHNTTYMNKCR